MIPDGWKEARLSDLATIRRGAGSKYLSYVEKPEDGIRLIRIGDFLGNDPVYVQHSRHIERFILTAGDVLIAGTGATAGIVFEVPDEFAGLAFSYNAPLIQMADQASKRYIYYVLTSSLVKRQQEALFTGNAQPFLDTKAIGGFKIPLPKREERIRIAEVLETWDRAIETVEALIANARAQKQALMQQLLPQGTTPPKKRLPGFSGEWRTLRIGDVAKEISERAGEEAGYPVLSCSKYDGMVESLTYFKKKVYSDDTSNYKVMRRGTFGFPSNHIEEGSIGYQDLFDAGIVSPIYCVFATDEQVEDGFLYKLLKTDRYRQIFAAATNASVDRRGSLRWKEFSRIPLPLPPLEEQRAINEAVNAVADVERGYESQLTALRQEKAALMQQLLTGKRRVKLVREEEAC